MDENSNFTNHSFNLDTDKRRMDTDSVILKTDKSYFHVEVGNYFLTDSMRENTRANIINDRDDQKSRFNKQQEEEEDNLNKQNLINISTSKLITPGNIIEKKNSFSPSHSSQSSIDEKEKNTNFNELASNLNLKGLNRQESQTDDYFQTNRTYNDFRRINKVCLARTKDTPNDKIFKHEVYIEGDIEMTSFREDPMSHRSSIKENKPFMFINLNKFSSASLLFTRRESKVDFFGFGALKLRKEEAMRYSCEFFSKLMENTSTILQNFKTYYKNVNLQSLMIFCIFEIVNSHSNSKFKSNFQNEELLENSTINLIKSISIEQILNLIPKYIEFLTSSFNNKSNFNQEDSFFNNLVIDKTKFAELGKYHIYSDVTNIINKYLNFLLLKWRDTTVENILIDQDNNGNSQFPELQSNYFYLLLIKIQHYIKHYFPVCCGTKNIDDIIYTKSPFALCYDCKLILCINCFKYHKLHEYFDFSNFIKNKDKNIHSDKEKFLNYQDSETRKKNKLRETNEDLIMETILRKFESGVYGLFSKGKHNPICLKKKKFLTVFDFFEIFLLEHLYKLVFPFILGEKEGEKHGNSNVFIGKEEFRNFKEKMAKDENLIKSITKAFIIAQCNSSNNCQTGSNLHNNSTPDGNEFITPKNATSSRGINYQSTSNEHNGYQGNFASSTPYSNLNSFNNLSSGILNEYYTTALNLYTEANNKLFKEVKKNRYIIEDLFYNALSNEFGVGKTLLESNIELNYEVPGESYAHFISQPNSPKQFYSNHLETTIRKFHSKTANQENTNYLNNLNTNTSTGFAGKTQFNKFLIEIAELHQNGNDLNTPVTSKKTPNTILSSEKLISPFKNKASTLGRKTKNMSNKFQKETYSLYQIISKALNLDKDLNQFSKSPDSSRDILIKQKEYDRKNGLMMFKYKDGYCSKYDLVSLYIEDLFEKIINYGRIKYKYKL